MKRGRITVTERFIIVSVLLIMTFCFCACSDTILSEPYSETVPPVKSPEIRTSVPTEEPTRIPEEETDFEIHFKDNFFREAVCSFLGKDRYAPVFVSEVEHLTRFSARVCRISDITEISYFKDLEDLDLYGNTITDLSPVLMLTNLKTLNISRIFSVMDGADKNKGLDLSPLAGLVNLETLDASGNMISDISPLSGLTALTRLDLKNNRITDTLPLSALVNLRWLDLSDNIAINYDTSDEQGVSSLLFANGLKELTYLNLYNNIIGSLEGLEGACKLETLDIRYNYVTELIPLMMHESLAVLYASNNSITSIAGLYGCSGLKTLNVDNNFMKEISTVILNLPSLSDFSFKGNPVTDRGAYIMWQMIRGDYNE